MSLDTNFWFHSFSKLQGLTISCCKGGIGYVPLAYFIKYAHLTEQPLKYTEILFQLLRFISVNKRVFKFHETIKNT